jgi:hypothetical protein
MGGDFADGHGQDIKIEHVVEMYTTKRFWIEDHDFVYVQYAMRCIMEMLVDNTFCEEIYDAFTRIDVGYKKNVIMNDDFEYTFDYEQLKMRLCALLRNEHYH